MAWEFESPRPHHAIKIPYEQLRSAYNLNKPLDNRGENQETGKDKLMSVTVEELSSIKKKLTIEVAADIVAEELENGYKKVAKTANIKGFRKGKIPKAMLEQHYGPRVQYDAINSLVNNSLYKSMVEHKIEAVSQPE
ncbi:MAG: hypothetical protein GQ578_04030, partial [Desulfuromonadaceae bacterium]|nr:hypothetical protein [Desulfuromonadaceae bacterium]